MGGVGFVDVCSVHCIIHFRLAGTNSLWNWIYRLLISSFQRTYGTRTRTWYVGTVSLLHHVTIMWLSGDSGPGSCDLWQCVWLVRRAGADSGTRHCLLYHYRGGGRWWWYVLHGQIIQLIIRLTCITLPFRWGVYHSTFLPTKWRRCHWFWWKLRLLVSRVSI